MFRQRYLTEAGVTRALVVLVKNRLNEAVVLNIAPLWELVPWKEARAYQEEPLEGQVRLVLDGQAAAEEGALRMNCGSWSLVSLLSRDN